MTTGLIDLPKFADGDIVTVNGNPAKRYRIVRAKQVNYLIEDEAGKRYNIKFHGVRKADDQSWATPAAVVRSAANVVLGSVVEIIHPALKRKYSGAYVVIGFTGDLCRLAKLGGDSNRYLKSLAKSDIKVVPV